MTTYHNNSSLMTTYTCAHNTKQLQQAAIEGEINMLTVKVCRYVFSIIQYKCKIPLFLETWLQKRLNAGVD